MSRMIKSCPKCKTSRGLAEVVCEHVSAEGLRCGFPLLNVRMSAPPREISIQDPEIGDQDVEGASTANELRTCPQGHENEPDDINCLTCGASLIGAGEGEAAVPLQNIGDWIVVEELSSDHDDATDFRVRSSSGVEEYVLRRFAHGVEPRTRVYPALQRLSSPRLARLVDFGRIEEHAYEVWEQEQGPTLRELIVADSLPEEAIADLIGHLCEAIIGLESNNLRHGDLTPSAIRFKDGDMATVQLANLSTVALAEFDLENSRANELTRYVSPESLVGSSSAASDWWSLGIIALELLTRRRYFHGVNDRAFLLQVVAHGVDIPPNISTDWTLLLQGLLTRDHAKRWRGEQVGRWVRGERNIPVHYAAVERGRASGPAISLGGRPVHDAAAFALSAASAEHWDEALALVELGTVGTWLSAIGEGDSARALKQTMDERRINPDQRFALALLQLNRHLPLVVRGEIVTPNRLLEDTLDAGSWLTTPVTNILSWLKRETWLVRLAERSVRVEARAEELGLRLVPERFAVARLAAFEARLEAYWRERRRMFPDAVAFGIAPLFERRSLTDEDLILLICTEDTAFRSAGQVVEDAKRLALDVGIVGFDAEEAQSAFDVSKRQLVDEISERVGAFNRIGQNELDAWADGLRLGRRLTLAQLLVLAATEQDSWVEPPHQDYLKNVLKFLQKKILVGVQRGPLVKLMIGRSASRIDLVDLGDADEGRTLLERVLKRDDQPVRVIGQQGKTAELTKRLKGIARAAGLYRRETGINALVIGYPLLTFEDGSVSGAGSVRIAPVALWPVNIVSQGGQVSLVSDNERDPELNPALERVLGEDTAANWRNSLERAVRGESHTLNDLFAAFDGLAKHAGSTDLMRVPDQSAIKGRKEHQIVSAGAVILAEFPSQAIVEDLGNILGRPIAGSSLEQLLRLKDVSEVPTPERLGEADRFTTLDADPSQEEAVLAARITPGLKLEGPPGTGKSQTIVNIITDCIGRGETVMLVCEKQAALEVVHKRLRAEGLGHRVVRIENTQSDRKRLLEELQTQVPALARMPAERVREVSTQRAEAAATVDQLELDLSAYHDAVYAPSESLGLSYRHVVSRIAALEDETKGMIAPELREALGALSPAELEGVIGEIVGLLGTWYEGDFSEHALEIFAVFTSDAGLEQKIGDSVGQLSAMEVGRRAALTAASPVSALSDKATAEAFALWKLEAAGNLRRLSKQTRTRVAKWQKQFEHRELGKPEGHAKRDKLSELVSLLQTLSPTPDEREHYSVIEACDQDTLTVLAERASRFADRPSFLATINPAAALSRSRARKLLRFLGLPTPRASAESSCLAAGKELALRRARTEWEDIALNFGLRENATTYSALDLRERALKLLRALDEVIVVIRHIERSPWTVPLWENITRTEDEWLNAFNRIDAAETLLAHSDEARKILSQLTNWLTDEWQSKQHAALDRHQPLGFDPERLPSALGRLGPYQVFRQSPLSATASKVFSAFVRLRPKLESLDQDQRHLATAALVRREAAQAWSETIRRERPVLARAPHMISDGVKRLASADENMRELNRRFLNVVDPGGLAPVQAWSRNWQIGGVNAKRLRQLFEAGRDLGLQKVRPIWLVSPDVASRIFPLEPGLFDVAIFDEASQMRVENAIAALYRGKRAIISGDSKQLPPTTFFGSAVGDDDEDEDDFLVGVLSDDADAEPAEQKKQNELANRRHVKDCQDLLALSQGVLPERGLTIHYRSAYRELIEFSNAAYYAGRLNIPVNHPAGEVARHKPIEVLRIDGVYQNQTNPSEADAVVAYLAELWQQSDDAPPTTGVVTFNLKQAELIDERIQARARADRAFKISLEREQGRQSDGEDVSFFVRNLENVQGDERDQIVFSTTFGRDLQGRFRRSFGVLTQSGGERRLNVAVTRAKSKVVVITSMPTNEISDFIGRQRAPSKARDYLQAYMRYAEHVTIGELDAARAQLSVFEGTALPELGGGDDAAVDMLVQKVRAILDGNGFKTALRPLEGAFAVDIAVIDPKTGMYCLGVELDGPRHHLLNSAKARDIWRARLLKRQGMQVHRVLSAAWAADASRERERLLAAASASTKGVIV